MNPELKYLFLSQDVITDATTKQISAIRIFETIFIPKGYTLPFFYSFYCVGRILLNVKGSVKSQIIIKLCDLSNKEVRSITLDEGVFNGEIGISFTPLFFVAPFKNEGTYSIQVSANINGGQFFEIGAPSYFQVVKIV